MHDAAENVVLRPLRNRKGVIRQKTGMFFLLRVFFRPPCPTRRALFLQPRLVAVLRRSGRVFQVHPHTVDGAVALPLWCLRPRHLAGIADGFAVRAIGFMTQAGYLFDFDPHFFTFTLFSRGLAAFAAFEAPRLLDAKIAPARSLEMPSVLAIFACTAANPGCFFAIFQSPFTSHCFGRCSGGSSGGSSHSRKRAQARSTAGSCFGTGGLAQPARTNPTTTISRIATVNQ